MAFCEDAVQVSEMGLVFSTSHHVPKAQSGMEYKKTQEKLLEWKLEFLREVLVALEDGNATKALSIMKIRHMITLATTMKRDMERNG